MIHSSLYQPNIYPIGLGTPSSISRVQAIDPTATTNFQRIKEIGRLYTVGYVRKVPTVTYRMTQVEYGSFSFWQQITNQASDVSAIDLSMFKTSAFDIAAFLTDDNGQYRGTMLYPYMRTSGFSLHIGSPEATAERTFNFIGEKAITWQNPANPYYIEVDKVTGTATDDVIDLSAWTPLIDPDVSDAFTLGQQYIFRIAVTVGGVTTILDPNVDYTYDTGTMHATLTGATVPVAAGQTYKTWFTSATPPTDGLFVQDNVDAAGINATSTSIFLFVPGSGVPNSADYLFRIQSCEIDVTFTRADLKEIGNRNIVQLGINLNKVSVKIGRMLEKFTIDEVLRGVVTGYGKLDLENYGTDVSLIVKIFSDDTKQTFLYGMYATQLAPQDVGQGVPVNAYVKDNATLEGEYLLITSDNSQLGNFTGPQPQYT